MIKLIRSAFKVIGGLSEKAWYLSKTQWANILALVSLALVNFGVIDTGWTLEEINLIAAGAIPVMNMILRKFTTKPLTNQVIPDGSVIKEAEKTLMPDPFLDK